LTPSHRESSQGFCRDIERLVHDASRKCVKGLAGSTWSLASFFGIGKPHRGFVSDAGGAHRFRLQQCRSLHTAVPRLFVAALFEGLSSGAVSAPFLAAKDAEVIWVIGANPAVNHPVAATFIKNAAKEALSSSSWTRAGRRCRVTRPRIWQFKPGSDVAMLNAMINTIITEGLTDDQ